MLGAAVGDALGSAYEFVPSSQIRAMAGSFILDYQPAVPGSLLSPRDAGIPTDDTAMALSLAGALTAPPPFTADAIAERFVRDLSRDGAFGVMFLHGGPGNACVSMLRALGQGARPFERIDANAGGNGAAMRAHPCGVFADRVMVASVSAVQAQLSHPHPGAVAAAETVALSVHDAIFHTTLRRELPPEISDPTMRRAWTEAHRHVEAGSDPLPSHLLDVDMAGWNTVSAAHAIALLFANDLEKGVAAAAASGGDTDTIGSITGAMLGALHGISAIPNQWLRGLRYRQEIECVANELADVSIDASLRHTTDGFISYDDRALASEGKEI